MTTLGFWHYAGIVGRFHNRHCREVRIGVITAEIFAVIIFGLWLFSY